MQPSYKILSNYDHLIDGSSLATLSQGDKPLNFVVSKIRHLTVSRAYQVKKLAAHLKADTLTQSAFNVYHFIVNNIPYQRDVTGKEQLRTPARSYADRGNGGVDCEDYAIFAGACFINMGYHPKHEIVAFEDPTNPNPSYAHIFCVVYQNKFSSKGIIVDPTPNPGQGPVPFNTRPHFIVRTMQVDVLEGTPPQTFHGQIQGLGGLAAITPTTSALMGLQKQLIEDQIDGLGRLTRSQELRKVRSAIMMNGLPEQELLLGVMGAVADIDKNGNLQFHEDADLAAIAEFIAVKDAHRRSGYMEGLTLGDLVRYGYLDVTNPDKFMGSELALEGLGNWFKKAVNTVTSTVKKAVNTVTSTVKKVGQATAKVARKVGQATVTAAKKVGQATKAFVKNPLYYINKINPVTIAARNGFLLVLRVNLFKLSNQLVYGMLADKFDNLDQDGKNQLSAIFAKNNVNLSELQKLKGTYQTVARVFDKLGGEKANLAKAIWKGNKLLDMDGGLKSKANLNGLSGLGEPVAAAATASSAIVVAAKAALKNIDWGKLLGKAMEKVMDKGDSGQSAESSTEQMPGLETVPAQEAGFESEDQRQKASEIVNESVPQNRQSQSNSDNQNFQASAPPTPGSNNTTLIIAGVGIALVLGVFALKNK